MQIKKFSHPADEPELLGVRVTKQPGRPRTAAGDLKRNKRQQFRDSARDGLVFALEELEAGRLAQVTDKVAAVPKWSKAQARDFNNAKLALVARWITYRKEILKRLQAI